MSERQETLEMYGIGVMQLVYSTKDQGMWYGCFYIHGEDYETGNFKTRIEAEDQAIREYEEVIGEN